MVRNAASRNEAAQAAGMTDHSLRQALKRPHVMRHYLAECEVLRLSGRAKRLHRRDEIAHQDDNKNAAVAAIKTAEQLGDSQDAARGTQQMPGLTIVIRNAPPQPLIDATPLPAPAVDHVDESPQEHIFRVPWDRRVSR
jgi:hypothetical protein